jgi:hypothetical protein
MSEKARVAVTTDANRAQGLQLDIKPGPGCFPVIATTQPEIHVEATFMVARRKAGIKPAATGF